MHGTKPVLVCGGTVKYPLLCVIASMNNMLCEEYHVSIFYLMY